MRNVFQPLVCYAGRARFRSLTSVSEDGFLEVRSLDEPLANWVMDRFLRKNTGFADKGINC